jgi:histidinol-phosphate aminotransferase
MKEYHPPLGHRDSMRLDFNENTFECSPRIIEVLAKISAGDLTRYPERGPVEAKVAAHLQLNPAQVVLTNGVDEAIHVLCETFLERDDEFLFPVPTYTMYEIYGSATEARIVAVQARRDFSFPFDEIIAAITPRTKLIAIANPNSPTGSVVSRDRILKIAAQAPHAIVLVDEAYFHFHGETIADLIGELPNLMLARTFSKAYGLAGLRLGVLAGAEANIQWIRRVLSPYSVNSLGLVCLPAALEDQRYLNWYVSEVDAARAYFLNALDQSGLPWWPTQANFVLVRVGSLHNVFVESMRVRGVLVRDRSSDPGCDGCVRITIGVRDQMERAVAALNASLMEIGWRKETSSQG